MGIYDNINTILTDHARMLELAKEINKNQRSFTRLQAKEKREFEEKQGLQKSEFEKKQAVLIDEHDRINGRETHNREVFTIRLGDFVDELAAYCGIRNKSDDINVEVKFIDGYYYGHDYSMEDIIAKANESRRFRFNTVVNVSLMEWAGDHTFVMVFKTDLNKVQADGTRLIDHCIAEHIFSNTTALRINPDYIDDFPISIAYSALLEPNCKLSTNYNNYEYRNVPLNVFRACVMGAAKKKDAYVRARRKDN